MRSFLDAGVNRERGRAGRRGHQNPKLAPWTKFKAGQIWAPREGRDSEIYPCLAWVVKVAESGVKGRQIRRPFHQDHYFLRIHNPGEKAAERKSSYAPTSNRSPIFAQGCEARCRRPTPGRPYRGSFPAAAII